MTDLLGIACEVKRTAAVVTHNPYTLTGSQGQCNVRVREEQSKDAETLHWTAEKVGFVSLAGQPPLVADMQTCNGKDPCELRCTLLWGAPLATGACTLVVRAERGDGAELAAVDIAVGDTVAESLPIERVCEPGEAVVLSAPLSISEDADVLLFSHWEVDGLSVELGQPTIQVEMTGGREAVAIYTTAKDSNCP